MKSHTSHQFHIPDYLVLLTILLIGASLVILFNSNRYLQQVAVIGLSLAYFIWGNIHHFKSQDHHWYVVLEYFLISALGASTLLLLITHA